MSDVAKLRTNSQAQEEMNDIEQLEKMLTCQHGVPRLVGPDGAEMTIPESLYHPLLQIVQALSSGRGVSVMPLDQLMTTQEAADCLNVSRPYFVQLLETGELPYEIVGKRHRRIRASDLMNYKAKRDEERSQALDEMTALLQDEGFYDE